MAESKHKFIILQFWQSEPEMGLTGLKFRALAHCRLGSSWRLELSRRLMQAAHTPWLAATSLSSEAWTLHHSVCLGYSGHSLSPLFAPLFPFNLNSFKRVLFNDAVCLHLLATVCVLLKGQHLGCFHSFLWGRGRGVAVRLGSRQGLLLSALSSRPFSCTCMDPGVTLLLPR